MAAIDHAGGKEQVVDTIEIRPSGRNIGYNGLMHQRSFARLRVRPRPANRSQGWLNVGSLTIPVALGRTGIRANKLEGDGSTPRGEFRLLRLWFRADRHPRPRSSLPVQRITRDLAWCEDPTDRRYNRPFRRRDGEPGDRLQRGDNLYDFVIEISHNGRPRGPPLAAPAPTPGAHRLADAHFDWIIRSISYRAA